MNNFKLRCVASDLDGTLLHHGSELSARTVAALERLADANIPLVVASGRPMSTIPKDVLALKALRYIITGNGVRIYDARSGESVYHCTIDADALEHIMRIARYYPVGYEFFIEGKGYGSREYVTWPERFGVKGGSCDYIRNSRAPIDDLDEFLSVHRGKIESMSLSTGDFALKDQLWHRLEHEVGGIYITTSIPRFIEITDESAGKRAALQKVLGFLEERTDGLVAFGDADNDLGMIELAGLGVAMGNGAAHLKEAADFIADAHDDDGAAKILERLLEEMA